MPRNVTIDNTNTTAIQYYPPLCNGTGWDHNQSELATYAVNNTYGWCSGSYNARATFQFTGVAVYLSCPQFATPDSMIVKLDDRPVDTIDLTSPTGRPVMSAVLWSVVDLPNKQHRVELLPGMYDGEIGFVSVDAFIVTELDPPRKAKKSKAIGIGVGVGLAAVLLILGLLAFFYFRKKRRSQAGNIGLQHSLPGSPVKPTFNTPTTTGATQPFISPTPTGTTYAPPYDPNAGYNQPAFNMADPAMAHYGQPQRTSMLYPATPSPQPTTPTSMTTTFNQKAPIYV